MQARIRLKPMLRNGKPRYCRWGTVPKKSTSPAAAASPVRLVQGRLCGCTKKPETKCWETQSLTCDASNPRFNTVAKVRQWVRDKGFKTGAIKVDVAAVPPEKTAGFRKQGCACDCKKLKTKTSCACACKE